MAACGISCQRLMRNIALFSGAIAVVVALLSLIIVPDVLSGRYELEQKAKIAADTTGLVAGSFKESRDGSWTFYSQGLTNDKQKMEMCLLRSIKVKGRWFLEQNKAGLTLTPQRVINI